jgi:hypothetical protein|mmetsp:Transcript_22412/g.38167  ORF Transcript_22412/g.38167 Transcript_22412/m.38167 type:complete len:225 (+) Transcript_22412:2635-3309(+)
MAVLLLSKALFWRFPTRQMRRNGSPHCRAAHSCSGVLFTRLGPPVPNEGQRGQEPPCTSMQVIYPCGIGFAPSHLHCGLFRMHTSNLLCEARSIIICKVGDTRLLQGVAAVGFRCHSAWSSHSSCVCWVGIDLPHGSYFPKISDIGVPWKACCQRAVTCQLWCAGSNFNPWQDWGWELPCTWCGCEVAAMYAVQVNSVAELIFTSYHFRHLLVFVNSQFSRLYC